MKRDTHAELVAKQAENPLLTGNDKDGYTQWVPPEDPKAEVALLGVCILDRESFPTVAASLRREDLTREHHRLVYDAMLAVYERGDPVSYNTVRMQAEHVGTLAAIGGSQFLAGLAAESGYAVEVRSLLRRIRYCATQRLIHSAANDLVRVAARSEGETDVTPSELLARAYKVFNTTLLNDEAHTSILTPGAQAKEYREVLERRQRQDPDSLGYPTGLTDLDRYVALVPGEYVVVMAPPGSGKTALLRTFQRNLAKRKVPTLFASAEQPWEQLVDRDMAAATSIDSSRIRKGRLTPDDWGAIGWALSEWKTLPAYMYDDPSMTTASLAAAIHVAKAKYGVKVVFVDYLQLLKDQTTEGTAFSKVTYITQRLVELARSNGVCVVVSSQVNRSYSSGGEPRRVTMTDGRQSGQIEQDAYVILGLYRPNPREMPKVAEVEILKNRNDLSNVIVPLYFDAEHGASFSNAVRDDTPGVPAPVREPKEVPVENPTLI